MADTRDKRKIRTGGEIPTEAYSDQPYIVTTDDGAWLCAVTTGAGHEGQTGQHVVTLRSTDLGHTWSDPVAVEPAAGPEASYAVMLKVPAGYPLAGRVYIFYNHNTDNVRRVRADPAAYPDGTCYRVDSLGHYVFKYSDDGGRTWSARRYDIPMRTMEIDRQNPYGGELKFFWNVGKPFVHDGSAYCSLHKVGGFGAGFFTSSEGVLLKSENLLTESDPEKVTWETLPDGEVGLRTPPGGGPVAEEQSYTVLSDGSFYVTYRTIDGYAVEAYSRDGGHTWSAPRYRTYADGRPMKHPRAATFVWRLSNGRYLTWFHNHGGRFIQEHPRRRTIAYEDRNPVWLSGGVEVDTPEGKEIRWSQPEISLYDDDPYIRISYPDLVEAEGRVFLTETQKNVARVHEIAPELLDAIRWQPAPEGSQPSAPRAIGVRTPVGTLSVLRLARSPAFGDPDGKGSIFRYTDDDVLLHGEPPAIVAIPLDAGALTLPPFLTRDPDRPDYGTKDLRQGLSLALWLWLEDLVPGQMVCTNRDEHGRGFELRTAKHGALELVLNDGRAESRWTSDPGMLQTETMHHVAVIVDGGPKIISFVIDGQFNDGGEARQFGWGRYNPHLRDVNSAASLRIAPDLHGAVIALRIYTRALFTAEAVAAFRAGPA